MTSLKYWSIDCPVPHYTQFQTHIIEVIWDSWAWGLELDLGAITLEKFYCSWKTNLACKLESKSEPSFSSLSQTCHCPILEWTPWKPGCIQNCVMLWAFLPWHELKCISCSQNHVLLACCKFVYKLAVPRAPQTKTSLYMYRCREVLQISKWTMMTT